MVPEWLFQKSFETLVFLSFATALSCTVLYSTVQYFLLVMIKNQKRAAECGLGEARFWFFSRMFTRCIKKSKKRNSKKLEFQTIFEKVTLEPLKKIWDLYQSIRLEKSVSKMGFLPLICGTNDHFIKKHWNFDEIFDFPGCGFSKFSKIWLSKGLNPSLYSIFHGDFEKKH